VPESGEIPFGEADGKGKCPELGAAHEKGPADDEVVPEEARLPRKRSSEGPGSPPSRGGERNERRGRRGRWGREATRAVAVQWPQRRQGQGNPAYAAVNHSA